MTEQRIGIVGSGQIACGLAAVAAARLPVTLVARSAESAARARGAIERLMERDGTEAQSLEVSSDADGLGSATFVLEAITEDLAVKRTVLGELGELAGPQTILASTTSSLPIAELAAACGRPDRFAGVHVFNPVPRMALVELIFPDQASDDTRARAHALCAALDKTAVEVPDVPGFVVNRLLFPYLFSAVRLLEETGLEPAAIDECMRLGAAHPIGPLALLDLVGLDVAMAIGETIGAEVPARLRELAAAGQLGRKSAGGFHSYAKS